MSEPPNNLRWFHLTPDRLIVALLLVQFLVLLADRLHWFGKGWAVLTTTVAVSAAIMLLLFWYAASRIFQWRFQFSIRSLLTLTLVIAIPSGWLALEKQRTQRQSDLVEWIRGLSMPVEYLSQIDANGDVRLMRPDWEPNWLQSYLGIDFFSDVGGVHLNNIEFSDAWLDRIQGWTKLRALHLYGASVTPTGLENLKGMTQLHLLDLDGVQVADAGMKHLSGMTRMKSLHLHVTGITDAGLVELRGMAELEKLDLGNNRITNVGLEHVQGMAELKLLVLSGTQVSDAGLERLAGLKRLRSLDLSGTRVTNEGVRKLNEALPHCVIRH